MGIRLQDSALLSEVAVNHLKTARGEIWPKRNEKKQPQKKKKTTKMRTKVRNKINIQIKKPHFKKGFPIKTIVRL